MVLNLFLTFKSIADQYQWAMKEHLFIVMSFWPKKTEFQHI